MAVEGRVEVNAGASAEGEGDAGGGGIDQALSTAQDTARRVAEGMPGAISQAQTAVADTARALDELPNQALLIGTSFSIGLGAGLLLSGANRLLVLLALTPAAAMAATLLGREQGSWGDTTTGVTPAL